MALDYKVDRATVGDDAGWQLVAAFVEPEDAAMFVAAMGGGRVRLGRWAVLEDLDGAICAESFDEAAEQIRANIAGIFSRPGAK